MNSIYQALAELETKNEPAALCTVVRASGSTPRHATSKMLVYPDGHILGSVNANIDNIPITSQKIWSVLKQ
ncbi:MAG: XdhC family protein [Euryarchaeota archaeon]|nr:XdhC family protein [Euryarchaeota archaeon]